MLGAVAVGSPAAKVVCPLVNRSDKPVCFEVVVPGAAAAGNVAAAAEAAGTTAAAAALGDVRIDHGDEDLQLLTNFHLCQFEEEQASVRAEAAAHVSDGGKGGEGGGAGHGHGRLGGAVAVRLLVQPRARILVRLPAYPLCVSSCVWR